MGNTIKVNRTTFQIRGKLGSGGFSEVYLVEGKRNPHVSLESDIHVDEKAMYALKLMVCQDDEQLKRALMEVQLHRRLKHVNVMPLLESEIRVKTAPHLTAAQNALSRSKEVLMLFPLFVMGSLQRHIERATRMPLFEEKACLHVFLCIARGVKEIHALGLAHRDIKPGNILLTDEYTPVVMDLGSAAPLHTTIETQHEATDMVDEAARYSSAAYRAPELWSDSFRGTLSGKTDVWSLGCTLYAMAFGPFSPFESAKDGVQKLAILNGVVKFPAHSSVSVAFVAFIQRMLQVDVDERPSLDDVIHQAQQLARNRTASDADKITRMSRGFPKSEYISPPSHTTCGTGVDAQSLANKGRHILSNALAL
ncbi:Aste57867_9263 [Aphanomyces stellatus]|uniref:non-specific serine/threonine protein kinase n=1 Tax=Aphanomyces stellatus TaxID=120398 RepID=A0A485KMR8_9STRA|nr:hypothetical protein As57867_009227 [Aphanomyces stellatus]VFT86146.1 Aste57867_9263 [Aphanomyces stellatus]